MILVCDVLVNEIIFFPEKQQFYFVFGINLFHFFATKILHKIIFVIFKKTEQRNKKKKNSLYDYEYYQKIIFEDQLVIKERKSEKECDLLKK